MTRELLLRRFKYLEEEILGTLFLFDDKGNVLFTCKTLELAYKDNRKNVSAVPAGNYLLMLEYSPRFDRNLWELKHVRDRSECKFHVANYYRELNGCIGLGLEHVHIDDDQYPDLSHSKDTLDAFHKAMAPATKAYLTILGKA